MKKLPKFIINSICVFIPSSKWRKSVRRALAGEKYISSYTLYSPTKTGKWAFISYLPNVYPNEKNLEYLLWHQNRREQIIIGKVFTEFGYNVKIAQYTELGECDDRKYDIIFGIEPCFLEMCKKAPHALKIYYGTTAYPKFYATALKKRIDEFNSTHNASLLYSRVEEGTSYCGGADVADIIFQIGTPFTLATYPHELRSKIRLINQSSNFYAQYDSNRKHRDVCQKDFLWMGSAGSILKGLDIVLDFFIQHPEFNLHVVGDIDKEFKEFYEPTLKACKHIKFYGFLSTSSELFASVAYRCAFNIFPSCSEGSPGSVNTTMNMGIIPILSQVAAFPEINNYGFMLKNLSVTAIEEAVEWASSLTPERFHTLIDRNKAFAQSTWNLERFESEFRSLLKQAIESKKRT